MLIAFLLCCLLSINVQADASELKIGAFNVQVFGKSKLEKAEVVETLTKVRLLLPIKINCYFSLYCTDRLSPDMMLFLFKKSATLP